jgi:hypothetical protein
VGVVTEESNGYIETITLHIVMVTSFSLLAHPPKKWNGYIVLIIELNEKMKRLNRSRYLDF